MDLLQSVRKEGSRGGRGDFKWDDVKADQHRENYLGHSVMAPVGRWQKNKDLSWYAKSSDGTQMSEADARKEEIRRIKEVEEDALAKALGYEVPSRNPNMIALGGAGSEKELQSTIKESVDEEVAEEGGKGVGFGGYNGRLVAQGSNSEVMAGNRRSDKDITREETRSSRREEPLKVRREKRRHSRSRSRDRERHSHRRSRDEHRSRSRSRSREPRRHRSLDRQRSGNYERRDYERRPREERDSTHDRSQKRERSPRRRRSRSPSERQYHSDRRRRNYTDNY